jgi:sugar phosphate isomerase/epimerase
MLLEYTSLALNMCNRTKLIEDAQRLCGALGYAFGIQAHHTISEIELKWLGESKLLTSLHGPVCGKYMLNLATDAVSTTDEWEKTVAYAEKYNVKKVVFHVFYMTDKVIPSKVMRLSNHQVGKSFFGEKYFVEGSFILSNYVGLDEHSRRLHLVKRNIDRINKLSTGVELVIENDFPSMGAGMLLSEHLLYMGTPLCIDVGHLWAAANVFGRNFHQELDRILESGNVVMVHLHVNPFPPNTLERDWDDGHKPLNTNNWMDMPRVVKKIIRAGIDHVTFEIYSVTTEDIKLFDNWCQDMNT